MLHDNKAGAQNFMQGDWNRLKFFEALASEDRIFGIVPGGGDYAH